MCIYIICIRNCILIRLGQLNFLKGGMETNLFLQGIPFSSVPMSNLPRSQRCLEANGYRNFQHPKTAAGHCQESLRAEKQLQSFEAGKGPVLAGSFDRICQIAHLLSWERIWVSKAKQLVRGQKNMWHKFNTMSNSSMISALIWQHHIHLRIVKMVFPQPVFPGKLHANTLTRRKQKSYDSSRNVPRTLKCRC